MEEEGDAKYLMTQRDLNRNSLNQGNSSYGVLTPPLSFSGGASPNSE